MGMEGTIQSVLYCTVSGNQSEKEAKQVQYRQIVLSTRQSTQVQTVQYCTVQYRTELSVCVGSEGSKTEHEPVEQSKAQGSRGSTVE